MRKRRRRLHDLYFIEHKSVLDHDYVWYNKNFYRIKNLIGINDTYLESLNGKEKVWMDLDVIAEVCYEVFEEELKTIETLFGEKLPKGNKKMGTSR